MQIKSGIMIIVMINTQDILNILLGIGVLIVAVCIIFTTYFLVRALKSITNLTDSLESTAQDIKSKLQMRVLLTIPALLIGLVNKIFRKRG